MSSQVLTTKPPALPRHVVSAFLREHYGLAGTLTALDSERDQNFRLDEESGGDSTNRRWVVKVANAAEELPALELQAAIFHHVEVVDPTLAVPRIRLTSAGDPLATCEAGGTRHFVRVVGWLDGAPFASATGARAALPALGAALGRLGAALRGFAHPGAIRQFDWDLSCAARSRARLHFVADPARRALAEYFLDRFDDLVAPALRRCRAQVIHGDANDHNVLVRGVDGAPAVALIDFGDAVHSALVNEVDVACAYAMLGSDTPVDDAATIAAAFHAVTPLLGEEVDLLFDLIAARLVISVTISASRAARIGANAYLGVSEGAAWELLSRLRAMDPIIVTAILRHACALEASPGARATTAWVEANRRRLAPLLDVPLERLSTDIVPFGDPAHPIAVATAARRPDEAERHWNEWAAARGVELGIGPYGEERAVYTANGFTARRSRRRAQSFAPSAESARRHRHPGEIGERTDDRVLLRHHRAERVHLILQLLLHQTQIVERLAELRQRLHRLHVLLRGSVARGDQGDQTHQPRASPQRPRRAVCTGATAEAGGGHARQHIAVGGRAEDGRGRRLVRVRAFGTAATRG